MGRLGKVSSNVATAIGPDRGRGRQSALREIADIRSVPFAAVQVDAHPDGGVRKPEIVTHEMERVAPRYVPRHPHVEQDLLKFGPI